MSRIVCSCLTALAVFVLTTSSVQAETPAQILAMIEQSAKNTPGFQGFSAARGEAFFKSTHGNDWSCATCHGDNPASIGKHAKTGRPIQPLAPSANPKRFTDPAKVMKWFRRNCKDVLNRVCTPQEQGDVLTYLLTVK